MNEHKGYQQSLEWLERAEQTIPLGSQTFSKSKMSMPYGAAPLFAEQAKGCQLTDIDGNQYTDFINGLLCVGLGYADDDVDNAIIAQLKSGINFSLAHKLEAEVAELLVELIPSAEMVRFAKNGTDVTSAAIRIARAYTGNEHIAVCGYHGWQDWYIGSTTRDLGVPESTKALTHAFVYNDLASLESLLTQHKFAAVIMEPTNLVAPAEGFLQGVRDLCDQHDCLLVFDEMITGFRFALGGAQSLFDVTPDMSTFGKGMANGMPLSALVGKKQYMEVVNDIFFSGTFGGECLSLAAAKANIEKLKSANAIDHIWQQGQHLMEGFNQIPNLELFGLQGFAPWTFLTIKDGKHNSATVIKSWLIQELCLRNILFFGTHNLSFSHKAEHIEQLLSAYKELLPLAQQLDEQGDMTQYLNGNPIEAVFKVR